MDVSTIYISVVLILLASAKEDWKLHCNRCHCRRANNKKIANCTNRGFDIIPDDLSVDIRVVDFSNNCFYTLERELFRKAHLVKVKELKLQNCSIGDVNEFAFSELRTIIELNLAWNKIELLNKNVFQDNVKLMTLILNNNKIKVLEDGLFHNLTFLQKILLDYNEIENVSDKSFRMLPDLNYISLTYNKIQRITFDMKLHLPRLNKLTVTGNPWICDCLLHEFRNSAQRNNLITTSTTCQSPLKLHGRSLLEDIVLACEPKVVEVKPYTAKAQTFNITLTCKATGDPTPDVNWMINGSIIEDSLRKNEQKYVTSNETINRVAWNNLTIIKADYRNSGNYICLARNPLGTDSRNVTIIIPAWSIANSIKLGTYSVNTYLIISLLIGFLLLLLIILIIILCFCKRKTRRFHSKRKVHTRNTEEFVMSARRTGIMKPPPTTIPPSELSGGIEVNDVKLTGGDLGDQGDLESDFEDDDDEFDSD